MSMTDNSASAGTVSNASNNEASNVSSFDEATESTFGSLAEAAAHLEDDDEQEQAPEAAASDDEAHQSETETQQPEPAEEPRYRLSDGTEATLTEIEEWRKGNLRQSDYTRKTMELADNRKALETKQAEINQQAQFFQQNVDFAIEVAKASLPQEPDISQLSTDPIGYWQQKGYYDQQMNQLQRLMSAKQQHQEQASQQQIQAHRELAYNEAKMLVEALPELKDTAKLQAFQTDLAREMQHYGIRPEELGSVMDHRLFRIASDAMKWRKLEAQKPKALDKARNAPPVQMPGQRATVNEQAVRANRARMEKLSQTGSINDAMKIDFE